MNISSSPTLATSNTKANQFEDNDHQTFSSTSDEKDTRLSQRITVSRNFIDHPSVNEELVRSLENSESNSPQEEDMDFRMDDEYEKEVPFDPRFYEDFNLMTPQTLKTVKLAYFQAQTSLGRL